MELVNGQIYKRNFQCFALLFVTSKNSKAYYSMLHISGHRDPKLTCPLIQHSGKGKYVFTEEELRKTFDADNWEPVEGKLIIDLQIDHIGGEDERNIRDLLCIIHRDGGHYISEHGIQKAFDDALEIHYRQRDAEEQLSTIVQQYPEDKQTLDGAWDAALAAATQAQWLRDNAKPNFTKKKVK